jgi:hypothetical protein
MRNSKDTKGMDWAIGIKSETEYAEANDSLNHENSL